jgi:hypothetical protein
LDNNWEIGTDFNLFYGGEVGEKKKKGGKKTKNMGIVQKCGVGSFINIVRGLKSRAI